MTFDDKSSQIKTLKELFIKSLLEWYHTSLEMENPSTLDFLDALSCSKLVLFL